MTKDNLIWLTKEIYRLTLLFPKKEPLRYKMRELADDILADLIKSSIKNPAEVWPLSALEGLEILDSFFEVAMGQNWVSPEEILAIQKEYANLREELKKSEAKEKTEERIEVLPRQIPQVLNQPAAQTFAKSELNQRQEMILGFLREQGRAQVWQIKQILPDVSKRTLRRDFERMLGQGVIERIGERNDTFYQIKTIQP